MAEFKIVNDLNLNGQDIINIPGALTDYDTLTEIATKMAEHATTLTQLQTDVAATQNYSEGITGTTGSVTAATHGLGAVSSLIVQVYDDQGDLVHGVDVNNSSGDIIWTTTASLVSGSVIVIGR